MATHEIIKDSSYWYNKFTASPADVLSRIHGKHYRLDRELAYSFKNIPGDSTTFELAMNFCQGYEPNLTAASIVPVICLAFFFEMTEDHCQGNLLDKAFNFFHLKILPHWNESVKAFQTTEHHFDFAIRLGLVDSCLESLLSKSRDNPRLLGEPFKKPTLSNTGADYRPIVRKKFLRLYELIISKMIQNGVQPDYVAASLFRYAQKLLPDGEIVLPCKLLFEMLRTAIFFHASPSCRYGLEMRIGKQLNEAVAEDLLTPSQDCVKRILRNFYANYTSSGTSGLIKVAELIEDYLAKLAADLTKNSFISLCAISVATTIETKGYSDGKEEVCQGLDCSRMSEEARIHASQNSRLPLRVVVQALFVGQLHLRDVITTRVDNSDNGSRKEEMVIGSEASEDARIEMDNRVIELENECDRMKRQIEEGVALKRKFGCMNGSHVYTNWLLRRRPKAF
ncbi:hypothetical protein MKW92_051339 [Papaver armeniacum]|nr:hypothetical protein MKW92_051339 [Papaver armeniacum]